VDNHRQVQALLRT